MSPYPHAVLKQKATLKWLFMFLVGRAGFEPATNGLKVRCSTDLATYPVKLDDYTEFRTFVKRFGQDLPSCG